MIALRAATMDDAQRLFNWRTDAETVAAAINTSAISWDEHVTWLKARLADERTKLLIAELDGSPVGTVRFDTRSEYTELSWTVAPEVRGKGVGKAMVALAASQWQGPLICRIKQRNSGSQRIASRAGFSLYVDGPLQVWRKERP